MKKILLVALVLSSFAAFADHHEENFDQAKAKFLAHLDQRAEHINKAKTCVSAATTKEALKACRQQMKAEGEAMRTQFEGEKQSWKAKKESEKAARKAKKEADKAAKQKK